MEKIREAIQLWLEVAKEDAQREAEAGGVSFTPKWSPFELCQRFRQSASATLSGFFEKLVWRIARQRGHIVMTNGQKRLFIPRHNPVNSITMHAIAKSAWLTPDEFRGLL